MLGARWCWIVLGAGHLLDGASTSMTLVRVQAGHKRKHEQDYNWMVLDNVGCRIVLDGAGWELDGASASRTLVRIGTTCYCTTIGKRRSGAFKQKKVYQNRTIIKEVISKNVIFLLALVSCLHSHYWYHMVLHTTIANRKSRAFKQKKFIKIGPLLSYEQNVHPAPIRVQHRCQTIRHRCWIIRHPSDTGAGSSGTHPTPMPAPKRATFVVLTRPDFFFHL